MKKLLIVFCAAVSLLSMRTARADVIDQIGGSFTAFPAPPPNMGVSAYSMTDTALGGFGAFSQTWDNFTFGSTLSVVQFDWVGIYDGDTATLNPDPPNLNLGLSNPSTINPSFLIRFYGDSGANTPGALLQTINVAAGASNETALAVAPTGSVEPLVHSYSTAISGFTANAGSQYWVSVVAEMNYGANGWGMALSNQGDLRSQQFFAGEGTVVDTTFDYAIRVTAVPEPSSGLSLLALVGLAAYRRRRVGR